MMLQQYDNYTAEQFLDDAFFIKWVKYRSAEDELFWQKWIASNPANIDQYLTAEKWLLAILSADPTMADEHLRKEIWEDIYSSINEKKKVRFLFPRWMAAASVILILVAGFSYFYFKKNNDKQLSRNVVENTKIKNDIGPGGNKATLTLSNGSTIILDSAQNGLLSKQGNAQVMKTESGKLVYEKQTGEAIAIQYNTISTPRGGQYQLTLADGSQVWLNAESSITFPTSFTGNQREVKISGEAYFEVAHNANMPFQVSVNGMDVKVLGTHFNVNAYEDDGEIKTTLLEGSVEVSKGRKSVIIKPGEQAHVAANIQVEKNVNLENVMAWKNRYFLLSGTSLQSLMRQISRWYDVDVSYDGEMPERKFGGSISYNVNLSTLLQALKENKVSSNLDGKKLILHESDSQEK
ncbi:MAG: FecR family protein [Ginsengibacter sp.]